MTMPLDERIAHLFAWALDSNQTFGNCRAKEDLPSGSQCCEMLALLKEVARDAAIGRTVRLSNVDDYLGDVRKRNREYWQGRGIRR